jgi:L-lactate dehydrogenase complex protein LldF
MANPLAKFKSDAENKSFDLEHRKRINFNIGKYNQSVESGKSQYVDVELARSRAAYIKRKSIDNLEKYLLEWETNFKRNGGKVLWAPDKEAALQHIKEISNKHGVKKVVKSKSMVTEEIHLNDFLQKNGISSIETDLGEYIQQLDGEPPYHIVTPAMHKSKEDIAKLFHEKLGTPINFTPKELTLKAREILRNEYLTADMGITGANFLLADIGGVSVLENEGNARLCASAPKVHVVIAGIEKILPSVNDLHLFLPLLSTFGTGQFITNYNTIYTRSEKKNPEEMYVILLDNGRTKLLAQNPQKDALSCIRCGACLNTCPVYKNIGGHSYSTTYSGPIGSIISPYFNGYKDYAHLSYASSLCGSCTDVCPVNIDIHKYLLYNRQKYVNDKNVSKAENLIWSLWKKSMINRSLMNKGGASLKNLFVGIATQNTWGKHKSSVKFASKSFNQQWKERNK